MALREEDVEEGAKFTVINDILLESGSSMSKVRGHYDVIIIGAGPVGGLMAKYLAKQDCTVLMIEEHMEVGKPFQCAGLVNPPAMEIVGLYETTLTAIYGARIHSPKGTVVPVGTEKVRTYAVCRKKFDQAVVAQALAAGAELLLDSHPTSAEVYDDYAEVTVNNSGQMMNLTCKLIIGADGAHSWVRRNFKMGKPKEMMIGYQIEVSGYEGQDGWLDMYTGSDIAPGFFAWVVPNGETHRVGMWSRAADLDGSSCDEMLTRLMNHEMWSERFKNCVETARFCGPIPGGVVRKPWKDRVLLIGDAAGLAKPTTGGGIGPGFRHVHDSYLELSELIKQNKLSQKKISKACKSIEKIRKEHDRARALRDFFVTTRDDDELEKNFQIFARSEVLELINEKGDIDKPVPLGLALLKTVPEFRGMAIKAGFALLFS